MEKRTENLTTEEAWEAMARGECVKTWAMVHRIKNNTMEWWSTSELRWLVTNTLDEGPYSIVPDPSNPVEVEDEYEKDRHRIVNVMSNELNLPEFKTTEFIIFLENYFMRKS